MANQGSRSQLAPRAHLLDALWRHLRSTQVVVLLLAMVAVALSLTAAIPQAPADTAADSQALQRWLATSSGLPGWAASLFHAVGLFQVPHSLWFRFLVGLAALALLIALIDGVEAMRRPAMGSSPPPNAPEVTLPLSARSVRVQLQRLGFREAALHPGEADVWYARKAGPARWGMPLLHAGLLVALVGAWAMAHWGWHGASWAGRVGQLHPTGHGTPYQVRLDRLDLSWTPDGQMAGYTSHVTVLEGGAEVKQAALTTGQPLVVGHVPGLPEAQVRLVGVAPRVVVSARDAQSRTQLLESPSGGVGPAGEIVLRFASGGSEHYVAVPGRDELFRLVYEPSPPSLRPAVRVEVQLGDGDVRSLVGRVSQGGQAGAGDLVLDLDVTWEPVLRADHTPGAGLLLGGALLSLIGAGAALAWVPRGVWLREDGGQAVVLPGGVGWEAWWPALQDRLEAACDA